MAEQSLFETTQTCRVCGEDKPLTSAHFFWRSDNRKFRTECKPCMSAAHREHWARYKDEHNHDRRLRKFNLTQEQFDALGTTCGVCGVEEGDPKAGRWGRLYVDHDHACCPGIGSCGECVRGLLCANCNKGIGNLGDDPERLISAAAYLIERGR